MPEEILTLITSDNWKERLEGECNEAEYRLNRLRIYMYNNPHCNFIYKRQEQVMVRYVNILKERLAMLEAGEQNGRDHDFDW